MKLTNFILLAYFNLFSIALGRSFLFKNNCSHTIWPASFTNPDSRSQLDSSNRGWEAPQGQLRTIDVPDGWSGRFWGRRDCDFSKPDVASCSTGACRGGLKCEPGVGTGIPPATLAEFTLNGDQGKDYYDVSNVDGFNLPVKIENNKNCKIATCTVDLNPGCPDDRMKVRNSKGAFVGCLSACQANLDGHRDNSPNCCSGQYATAQTCPTSGVQYYDYFKSRCPDSYAYAYDEASQSALYTCVGADYVLTFCPQT
ncbi:hypothetical protein O181_059897 [Austropuccinia psidii MF-1]|uniref:Thaumatin-like protein n=1 Tax=Austropuccinia psidii MF-1 TaxID=1389203 RepID=A0A9Q3HXV3_9BASI|nr:hypothetical protein [Austropuccinia psidii MF-1]